MILDTPGYPARVRSPTDVLHDHLRRRAAGDVDGDVEANYADDVLVIDRYQVRHGHDGVRAAAAQLAEELPNASFEYVTTHLVEGIGYLEWRAEADGSLVRYGADSFVITDGLIRAQTLYYRVAGD